MGKPKAPKPPDYTGAAEAQAESSRRAIAEQTYANRPTQITPWGSSEWTPSQVYDPVSGQNVTTWEQNISLDPELQAALDAQQRLQAQRSGIAGGLYDRLAQEQAQAPDWSTFQPFQAAPTAFGEGLPSRGAIPSRTGELGEYGATPTPDRAWGDVSAPDVPWGRVGTPATPWGGPENLGTVAESNVRMGGGPQLSDLSQLRSFGGQPEGPVSPEALQRALSTQGLGALDPSQRYRQDAESAIYGQFERRAEPRFENQMNALDVQLRNQGLTPGDEAYDYQMQQLRQSQDDARLGAQYQATMGAGQEAQRMLGMDAATRAQLFGERGRMGDFANQAARDAFGMASTGFNQGMALGQLADARRAQQLGEMQTGFGQQMGLAGLNLSQQQARDAAELARRQQQYGEEMGRAEFADRQRIAQLDEQLRAAGYSDAQRQQMVNEQLAIGGYGDRQRGQQFAEGMGMADLADRQRGQQFAEQAGRFGQDVTAAQLADQQRQAALGEQAQQFGQGMAAAGFNNQLRQQQIAEQMMQQGWTLNQINALMSGQQVGLPQMPGFGQAGAAQPTNYLGAAGAQGQFAQDLYSAENARLAALYGGISDLATGIAPFFIPGAS